MTLSRKHARRAGAGLAVAALVATQANAMAADGDPVRITRAFNATGDDLSPTRTYSAPHVAVDPEDPMRMVAATPEYRTKVCRLMVTSNGGRNWRLLDSTPSQIQRRCRRCLTSTMFRSRNSWPRSRATVSPPLRPISS